MIGLKKKKQEQDKAAAAAKVEEEAAAAAASAAPDGETSAAAAETAPKPDAAKAPAGRGRGRGRGVSIFGVKGAAKKKGARKLRPGEIRVQKGERSSLLSVKESLGVCVCWNAKGVRGRATGLLCCA
jgi:hypothetical protein